MGQVLVRNLDDAVIEILKMDAEQANVSLEQSLRDILTERAGRTKKEKALALADRIRARSGRAHVDSVTLIREDRDSDHGREWPGT